MHAEQRLSRELLIINRVIAAAFLSLARCFMGVAVTLASFSFDLDRRPLKRGRKRLSRRRGRKWRERQARYILPFRRRTKS